MGESIGQFVDFGKVADLEDFRDYFDSAPDLGRLEKHRSKIDRACDLERLRPLLEGEGRLFLPGCVAGDSQSRGS